MNRRPLRLCSAALLAAAWLSGPAPADAWSGDGHRIVARIAEDRLSPSAAREAARLLAGEPLSEAALWADRARDEPAWEWTWRLHFVNVPDGAKRLEPDRDCPPVGCPGAPASGPPRCCVVGAIEHYLEVLADPASGDAPRATALRFLLHFVGDLHQPLHVSRASDRGGNEIDAELFGEPMDLHEVWDRAILDRSPGSFWGWRSWRSTARRLTAGIEAGQADRWRRGDPWLWAQESLTLALEVAYPAGPPPYRLGEPYLETALPVVQQQLRKAGVRLAQLLEAALAPPRPE